MKKSKCYYLDKGILNILFWYFIQNFIKETTVERFLRNQTYRVVSFFNVTNTSSIGLFILIGKELFPKPLDTIRVEFSFIYLPLVYLGKNPWLGE